MPNIFTRKCCSCGKQYSFTAFDVSQNIWIKRFCSNKCFELYTLQCESVQIAPVKKYKKSEIKKLEETKSDEAE